MSSENLQMVCFSYVHSLISYVKFFGAIQLTVIPFLNYKRKVTIIIMDAGIRDSCRDVQRVKSSSIYSQYILSLLLFVVENKDQSGRYQKAVLEDISSNWELNKYGVPQGSTFGPLLFLLYTNENFKTTNPSHNIDQRQLENVKCFRYLGSMLTDDGKCTCEIKSRIDIAKAAFNNKK
jgi:hypothetical protein